MIEVFIFLLIFWSYEKFLFGVLKRSDQEIIWAIGLVQKESFGSDNIFFCNDDEAIEK